MIAPIVMPAAFSIPVAIFLPALLMPVMTWASRRMGAATGYLLAALGLFRLRRFIGLPCEIPAVPHF